MLSPKDKKIVFYGSCYRMVLGKFVERIKDDKKHPGVILELHAREAIWYMRLFLKEGIITEEDLDGFSLSWLNLSRIQCIL